MRFADIKLGKRLAVIVGMVNIMVIALLMESYLSIDRLSSQWEHAHGVTMMKSSAASKGKADLGDGIHWFKDFVLRGQDYDQKFIAAMAAIDQDAADYASHDEMTDPEKTALQQIRESTDNYRAALKQAQQLKSTGAAIDEIDKAVKGADRPLGKAFDDLLAISQQQIRESSAAMSATASYSKRETVITGILITILTILFGWMITRSITRPLLKAVKVADAVAKGDLDQVIEVRSKDETGQLLRELKDMTENLSRIVAEVRNTTDSIAIASQEIAQGNADLSSRTEMQASSLEETASSMEELTSTVRHNAENARQANQLAANASDIAVRGGEVVDEVVHTMASISDSSRKIVDIISVIEGIAFQTNILALNAAVEAARAGEQGRGFAVVAGEVRTLAQRSAEAAKDIKFLIDDSVGKVDMGANLVDQAGATMTEIVEAVKRVTDIMSEISAASAEQSAGIEQVNLSIAQMDDVVQQNAALVEEAAAAAESMREQANSLKNTVNVFKLKGPGIGSKNAVQTEISQDRPMNTGRNPVSGGSSRKVGVISLPGSVRRLADFAEIKNAIIRSRRSLIVMIKDTGKRDTHWQKMAHDSAQAVTELLANASAPSGMARQFRELVSTWEAFRSTRENELIPALLKGRESQAKAIAEGMQKERLDTVLRLCDELNSGSRAAASDDWREF